MDLSIIIVNYNTKDLLQDCLNSIIANTEGVDYEIILVDNGSADGSLEMLKSQYRGVRVIRNVDNLGFAKANNQGIRIATGNNILLLNSDTTVTFNCLPAVLNYMNVHDRVGVIGCKVLYGDGKIQHSCYHSPNLLTEIAFFSKDIIVDTWDPLKWWKLMKYKRMDQPRPVDCIGGCFFWVRKEVFAKVGLFDETFFLYYEDSEFCNRVRWTTHYEIRYFPDAEIIHFEGGSSKGDDYFAIKQCYLSGRYYLSKCYGKRAEITFVKWLIYCWTIERFLFKMLRRWPKFQRKTDLLNELLVSANHPDKP